MPVIMARFDPGEHRDARGRWTGIGRQLKPHGSETFYHGTVHDFKPGEMVTAGHPQNFGIPGPAADTFFADSPDTAHAYARYVADERGRGEQPRVYRVEPTGTYELIGGHWTGRGWEDRELHSHGPLRVLGEVSNAKRPEAAAASPSREVAMPDDMLETAAAGTGAGPDGDGWHYALVTVDDVLAELEEEFAAAFNPSQPRVPAGQGGGGQFAPASGGGGKDARPAPSNQRPVGEGERGKRVSDLQKRLNALGAKPKLAVDGVFGPKTLAAVKAYQKAHGLKTDGLVGPKTTAALRLKNQAGGKPASGRGGKTSRPAKKTTGHSQARKLSDKPGSITAEQKTRYKAETAKRKIPAPDLADFNAGLNSMAESEAAALITHIQKTYPLRKTAKAAVARHAAGDPDADAVYVGWDCWQVGGEYGPVFEFTAAGAGFWWREVDAAEWKEDLHPRGPGGKFAPKGMPGGGPRDMTQAHPAEAQMLAIDPAQEQAFNAGIGKATVELQVAEATKQISAEMHLQMRDMAAELQRTHAALAQATRAEHKAEEKRKTVTKLIHHFLALGAVAILTWINLHMDVSPLVETLSATGPLFLQEAIDAIRRV